MKITVWYLLVICLIKVKEMVNYIFAKEKEGKEEEKRKEGNKKKQE